MHPYASSSRSRSLFARKVRRCCYGCSTFWAGYGVNQSFQTVSAHSALMWGYVTSLFMEWRLPLLHSAYSV